jgi:hypothetical protein
MLLVFLTILTWAGRILLMRQYNSFFRSTFSFWFRLVEVLTVLFLTTLALLVFRHFIQPLPSSLTVLLVMLPVFGILDFLFWRFFRDIRKFLDIWHFIAGYAAIGLCICLLIK